MMLINLLSFPVGIAAFVCFVLVIVQMFKHGETGIGIACCVLALCGIGVLIAFVYGWIKSSEWDIKNIMLIWTALIGVNLLLTAISFSMAAQQIAEQMPAQGF